MKLYGALLAFMTLAATPAALAAEAQGEVTFLFTGDNGGEVSPCG